MTSSRATRSMRQGQEIVEATTGNTGIALAMIGARLGHPVRVVVPEIAFSDISRVLRAYGPASSSSPASPECETRSMLRAR